MKIKNLIKNLEVASGQSNCCERFEIKIYFNFRNLKNNLDKLEVSRIILAYR
jgi:hypothetical protein